MGRSFVVIGTLLVVVIFLPVNIYAQGEYEEINWMDAIGYFVSNFWLSLQLLADQPNIDSIYEKFAEFRNNWVFENKLPTNTQLESFTDNVNERVASKEFCQNFTPQKITNIIKADIPYEKLDSYCNIPKELDSHIRDKLS